MRPDTMRAVTNWRRPSALSPALLAIIAVVVLGVLTLLLLLVANLFSGPRSAATPGPSTTVGPASTGSATTAEPGASATIRPADGTDAPPTDATLTAPPAPAGSLTPEQALVAHVPEPIRATCTVEPGAGQAELVASCAADDGALVITYLQYATAEDMAAAFADRLERSQIEPSTGTCEDQATWPAEGQYSVGGEPTGRRLCTDEPGLPTIFWTDDRLNIMGQVSAESAAFERLIEFWTNESGPVP